MKNYILDTNVLLYDPNAIHRFKKNLIIIPVEIVDILDSFKRNITELGQNSRTVSNYLEQLSSRGDLGKGVPLENGGKIRLFAEEYEDCLSARGLESKKRVDNRLLNLAIWLTKKNPKTPTIIISKNINLRLKADALGIKAADYEDKQTQLPERYKGFAEITVSADILYTLKEEGRYSFTDQKFSPNDYILLKDGQDSKSTVLGRITGIDGTTLIPLSLQQDDILGIRPMNLGQTFAFDALLDDNIKLVSLLGKAGTGKTLIAVAAGLFKVLREGKYTKLLISRPTMPMGRDIGFIPGDIDEKMRPWMQPIYDAVEMIREQDRRSRKRSLPKDILESDDLGIEPLTYIRGRSIPHQYFIIDEAQNLTPHEVKTIITRVGQNSKVVLTGDPEQIDNPYVDSISNGFSYLVNRFRNQEIAAHITLTKGERSKLAEIAANVL